MPLKMTGMAKWLDEILTARDMQPSQDWDIKSQTVDIQTLLNRASLTLKLINA